MPWKTEWVPAEVFYEYKGIKIYHVYRNDEVTEGVRDYFYSLSEDSSDQGDDETSFDVRELSTWNEKEATVNDFYGVVQKTLQEAIDKGELKPQDNE